MNEFGEAFRVKRSENNFHKKKTAIAFQEVVC